MTHVLQLEESGLYCPAGDFWIDPWEPVDTAFITHGHSDHCREGHQTYHGSNRSLPIMQLRVGDEPHFVGHEYGEVIEIGDATVSFHPAGHIRGSSQVRVEVDGKVWVVSGDYKRETDPTCESFEVVECDVFITEATFALPVYRWEPGEVVGRDIWEWWQRNEKASRASVLFSYTLGKAQRILAELAKHTDRRVYVHGAVEGLTDIYRDQGVEMLPTSKVVDEPDDRDWEGELVLTPPSANTPGFMKRFGEHRSAFASGWMRIRGIRRRRGFDHGFVLSDHADWDGLIRTVRETGARRVLATHGKTDSLVKFLREEGLEAEALQTAFGTSGDDQ